MPRLKIYLTALLAAILLIPTASWSLQAGTQLPELSGQDLNGNRISLSQFKGQAILLKVGTTWCPTCSQQSHEIAKLREFISRHQIRYVEVFVQETKAQIEHYFASSNYLQPDSIIVDQGEIARALNIYLIPRLIIVDNDFKVFHDGDPLMAAGIKNYLQKMLTKK